MISLMCRICGQVQGYALQFECPKLPQLIRKQDSTWRQKCQSQWNPKANPNLKRASMCSPRCSLLPLSPIKNTSYFKNHMCCFTRFSSSSLTCKFRSPSPKGDESMSHELCKRHSNSSQIQSQTSNPSQQAKLSQTSVYHASQEMLSILFSDWRCSKNVSVEQAPKELWERPDTSPDQGCHDGASDIRWVRLPKDFALNFKHKSMKISSNLFMGWSRAFCINRKELKKSKETPWYLPASLPSCCKK